MKRLSNAEIRTIYMLRASLPPLIEGMKLRVRASSQYPPDLTDFVGRTNSIRAEVKSLVQDIRFDLHVPEVQRVRDGPYRISIEQTLASTMNSVQALCAYIDTLLQLHMTPKIKDLNENPGKSARVFVGHGRNAVVWQKVKIFLQDRCGLDPIVLELEPSTGLTVIEKLEKYGRLADYAVIVMTGDDRTDAGDTRARQNIIQELGWFQGVLGRGRTAILMQSGVEVPSNLGGIVYIEFPGDIVEAAFDTLRLELESTGLIDDRRRST